MVAISGDSCDSPQVVEVAMRNGLLGRQLAQLVEQNVQLELGVQIGEPPIAERFPVDEKYMLKIQLQFALPNLRYRKCGAKHAVPIESVKSTHSGPSAIIVHITCMSWTNSSSLQYG